jgi:hypothetical protein
MSSSPSISNYENLGLYVSSSHSSTSAGERNGRVIRYRVKRAVEAKPEWKIEECTIEIRNSEGVVKTVNGFSVTNGTITKRFVNMEGVNKFIQKNK